MGDRVPVGARRWTTRLRASALERTRFVFWVFALVVVAAAAGMLVFAANGPALLRGAGALGLVWIAGRDLELQRSGRASLGLVALDAAALLGLAAAIGAAPSAGIFFLGVFYRSLYGARSYVIANALAYLGVYVAAAFVLRAGGAAPVQAALTQCVGLLFTALVMRIVFEALSREERARARERLLREVAAELVAARDSEAVYRTGLSAVLSLLPREAAARVAIWLREPRGLRAVASVGDGAEEVRGAVLNLDAVPAQQIDAIDSGRAIRIDRPSQADERAMLPFPSKRGGILIVPLRTQDETLGVMVTGSDHPLPVVAEDTMLAIASQVALALETERLTADLHRRQSEERFGSLIANASDVITLVAADGVVSYQTPSIERVLGYQPQALLGRPITDLIHPSDRAAATAFLDRATRLQGASATAEWRIAHRDGAWRHVEVVAVDLTGDPNVRGIVLTSRDITERKALERRLAHQAFHDPLTGLPNRELFRDRVQHALSRAKRTGRPAILFIDVDDFKNVNDTMGHASGDRMLALIAERLRSCVRPGDTAARLGGDEFGLLLEHVDASQTAVAAANRVLAELAPPLALGSRDVPVRVSIGIALAEPPIAGADELLRNADIAMYAAKADGKSRLRLFETSMYAQTVQRVELRDDLSRAVARQQLRLHYQPIVELGTGRPVGFEALVRWQHPERGLLYPIDFVALAEETGLIVPIGRWVMHEACRQLRAWRNREPRASSLTMSINLSPGQLAQPGVIDDVARALSDHRIDPATVVLEITESAVMKDLESAIARLDRLASLGVRLALDDFGTGYSSLSYLQRFPLHVLKLDRSFTEQLKANGLESQLPRAIVELAQTLELIVVAEGVEEEPQAERLFELGCRLAQGYHYARPLSADKALAYLRARGMSTDPSVEAA